METLFPLSSGAPSLRKGALQLPAQGLLYCRADVGTEGCRTLWGQTGDTHRAMATQFISCSW